MHLDSKNITKDKDQVKILELVQHALMKTLQVKVSFSFIMVFEHISVDQNFKFVYHVLVGSDATMNE